VSPTLIARAIGDESGRSAYSVALERRIVDLTARLRRQPNNNAVRAQLNDALHEARHNIHAVVGLNVLTAADRLLGATLPRQAVKPSRSPVGLPEPLRSFGAAVRDVLSPPISRVKSWTGTLPGAQFAGVKINATPVEAEGSKITWRISVDRGGERVGLFETKLSGQVDAAQFAVGKPLNRQVLDLLRAPQKRLQALGATVAVRTSQPGGDNLQATVVSMQEYRQGKWQTVGFAVGEVRAFAQKPLRLGQQAEALGYFRRSVGRGEPILMSDGSRPASLEQAKARVQEMMQFGGLTVVSASDARAAAAIRQEQRAAIADLSARLGGGAGSQRLEAWKPPVPLPKPIEQMSPIDRIAYTVKVAQKYLPAAVGRELQALMTPDTIKALASAAGLHATGLGFIADGMALGASAVGIREGLRSFARYVQTTLEADHPMQLADAGRQLSELGAPALVEAVSYLGARTAGKGIGQAVKQRGARRAPAPSARPTPPPAEVQRPANGSSRPLPPHTAELAAAHHESAPARTMAPASPVMRVAAASLPIKPIKVAVSPDYNLQDLSRRFVVRPLEDVARQHGVDTKDLRVLVLVRHGESKYNESALFAGNELTLGNGTATDPKTWYAFPPGPDGTPQGVMQGQVPLTEKGKQQAIDARPVIQQLQQQYGITTALLSPVHRAQDTFNLATEGGRGFDVRTIPALMERGMGANVARPKIDAGQKVAPDPGAVPSEQFRPLTDRGFEAPEQFDIRLANAFSRDVLPALRQRHLVQVSHQFSIAAQLKAIDPSIDTMKLGHDIPNGKPLVLIMHVSESGRSTSFRVIDGGYVEPPVATSGTGVP
jgi:broad specificity phosphatase PhoE